MSNLHLSLKPYNLDVNSVGFEAWVYEDKAGFYICMRPKEGPVFTAMIPWKKIRDAVRRKDRKV